MNEVFFWISKLTWLLISPDSLILLWISLGVTLLWFNKTLLAKLVLTMLPVVLVVIGFFPVGEWLLYPLESSHPANPLLETVDGIIMLGGAEDAARSTIWNQVTLGESSERNLAFIALARRYPNAKLVFTGGSGSLTEQEYKEADVAKRLLIEHDIDISRVIFEPNSRNTWENAKLSKEQVNPQQGEKWLLITTGWHMPRAMGVFCKAEWPVTPYPVDFRTKPGYLLTPDWNISGHLGNLVTGFKEWLGLFAYRLTGKSC